MMIVAQISDFHVGVPGSKPDAHYRTADYLARAVAHLNALQPRPDLVVGTGDLVDQGNAAEYARLRELLEPLAMPIYLIPGNHDSREHLAAAFAGHGYLPDGGMLNYVVDDLPLRLVALDTTIPGESGGRVCQDRLAWLEARLAEAPERPTLLLMHHPPFRTGLRKMDDMGLEGGGRLEALLARFGNVERILCGHLHRPISRRFAGTVVCVCPATAHQIALDLRPTEKLALVMEPPACLLHVWLGAGDGLVSHTSYIAHPDTPFEIFDGTRWRRDAVPPARPA